MKRFKHMKKILCGIFMVVASLLMLTGCSGCNGCGGTSPHSHTIPTTWSYDETYHWYVCADNGCSEKLQQQQHSFNGDTCSICGYEKEDVPPTPSINEVTEAQFAAAFAFENIDSMKVEKSEVETVGVTILTSFYLDENRTKYEQGETSDLEIKYYEVLDEYAYSYTYADSLGWFRSKIFADSLDYEEIVTINYFSKIFEGIRYSECIYAEGYYTYSQTFAQGTPEEYVVNFKFHFENGNLISTRGEYVLGGRTHYTQYVFSGHNSTTVELPAEFTDETEHVCSYVIEKEDAKYVVVSATCTEPGVYHKSCSCGKAGTDTFTGESALGHDWSDWVSNGDDTHTRICSRDDTHIETLDCAGGSASCTQKAICDSCKTEYGTCGHAESIETGYGPSCLKKGYTDRIYCSVCGETLQESEVIPKVGHQLGDWYTVSESTETVAGVQRRECSACAYFETQELPLKGHNYELDSIVAPTCAEYGYSLYKCTDCSHTYKTDFVDKLPHNEAVTVFEATCVLDGYTMHECTTCDYEYITDHVVAFGHVYGDWYKIQAASCEEDGCEHRECLNDDCDEFQSRSISAFGHRYILSGVEETWEKIETTYTCEICQEYVVITDETKLYDASQESQLIDQPTDFTFTVICHETDAEDFIRENLVIIDAYFLDTEYEVREEVKWLYTITKSVEVENGWIISPQKAYEQGYTYVAKIETGLAFADYYGRKLTYSIKSEEREIVVGKNNVIFLQTLEKNSPGYYPYQLSMDSSSEYVYLGLQKIDGIEVGDIVFVGEAESITEIFNCDTECCFGKVEIIYVNDDSEYILVLSCPELGEVFEKLDIHYEELIDFDKYPEVAENLQQDAVETLYASDDFAEFLAVSDLSLQNYCLSRSLTSEPLTRANFSDNVKIGKPVVKVSGTTIYLQLTGSFQSQLKTKNGTNIGNFAISFSVETSVGFNVGVDYKLTYFWFIPTGVEFFDIRLTQTDDFKFDFSVAFNVDYELAGNELAEEYVYHKDSKKIHTTICSHVENGISSNFISIRAEELYLYSQTPGYTVCTHCKPIEGLDRTAFVINKRNSVVHCHNCYYAELISVENREVTYSLKGLDSSYTFCDYCKPESKVTRDFETEMLNTLEYVDWAKKVVEIKEMATSSGSDEYKTSGVKLCTIHKPFAYVFTLNLDVRLVLSFKFEASLNYHYEQAHTNVYGIRLQHGHLKSYSSHREEQKTNELTVVGSMDFKVGVNADLYVSIVGLSRWVRAGFTAEAGLYIDMDGVAHITSDTNVKSYAAIYFEAGPYIDVSAYYKLFGWDGSVTIYEKKFPIFVYGYDNAYYGYVNDIDSINLSSGQYVLEGDEIFEVFYYDVKGHKTGSKVLSLNGGKLYTIDLELEDGSYCSIVNGKLVVSSNAPCTFSDVLTISVVGNTTWKNYVKGSSAFFLDEIQIVIYYFGGDNHAYVLDTRVEPTCTEEGYKDETCSLCGHECHTVLKATGHTEERRNGYAATCLEDGLTDEVYCTVCQVILAEHEIIPALGHDLIEHKAKEPTCVAVGWFDYIDCSRCSYTTYQEIDMIPHEFTEWVEVEATGCVSEPYMMRMCVGCELAEYTGDPSHPHSYVIEKVDATCTEKGYIVGVCVNCNERGEPMWFDALGHKFVVSADAEGHTYTCTRQNCDFSEKEDHTALKKATCLEDSLCSVCKFVLETASGHYFEDEYRYDAENHWLICENDNCSATKGVEKHYGGGSTCAKPAVCDACGHSYGDYLSHEYNLRVDSEEYLATEATCLTRATYYFSCVCGEKGTDTFEAGELAGHNFGAWVSNGDGTHTHDCLTIGCGIYETVDCGIHKVSTTSATCVEKGCEVYECSDCEYEYTVDIDALGHSYGEWIPKVEPTCERIGYKAHYQCSACRKYFDENKQEIANIVISKLGHTYDQKITTEKYLKQNADCLTKATYYFSCECGAKGTDTFEVGELVEHNFGLWVSNGDATHTHSCLTIGCDETESESCDTRKVSASPATCLEKGSETYECADCGYTYTVEIEILEHSYGEWVPEVPASCEKVGYKGYYKCSSCNKYFDANKQELVSIIIDKLSHVYDQEKTEEKYKANAGATCTGRAKYYYSCVCGAKGEEMFEIGDLLDHSYGQWNANNDGTHTHTCTYGCGAQETEKCGLTKVEIVASTCTKEGNETWCCSDCGYEKTKTLAMKDHDYGDWNPEVPATCMKAGVKGHYKCSVCEKYFDENKIELTNLEIEKLGHTYDQEIVSETYKASEATCLNRARYYYSCVCGEMDDKTFEVGELADHSYGAWTSNDDQTHTKYCSVVGCSAYETDDCSLELKYREDSSCTKAGKEVKKCVNCDYEEVITLEIKAHAYGEWVDEIPATCISVGMKGHYQCSSCKQYFDIDKNEIDGLETPQQSHSFVKEDISDEYLISAATCISRAKYYYSCEYCGEKGASQFEIGGFAEHNWSDAWNSNNNGTHQRICLTTGCSEKDVQSCEYILFSTTEATCEENGYYTHKCDVCKHSYKEEFEIKLGHDYGEWESLNDGTHQRVCGRDSNHIEKETCDLVTVSAVGPTCTEQGYTIKVCVDCSYEKKEFGDPAIEHDWGEFITNSDGTHYRVCLNDSMHIKDETCSFGEKVVSPTCEESGYTVFICPFCTYSYVGEETNAKGHNIATEYSFDDESHYYVCLNGCDKQFEKTAHVKTLKVETDDLGNGNFKHTMIEACSVCAYEHKIGSDIIHVHNNPVPVLGTDADCVNDGLTHGLVCGVSGCGEVLVEQETIPALGHDFLDGYCTRCQACSVSFGNLLYDFGKYIEPIIIDSMEELEEFCEMYPMAEYETGLLSLYNDQYFAKNSVVVFVVSVNQGRLSFDDYIIQDGVLTINIILSYSYTCGRLDGMPAPRYPLYYFNIDSESVSNVNTVAIERESNVTVTHLPTLAQDFYEHWEACAVCDLVMGEAEAHNLENGVCTICGYEAVQISLYNDYNYYNDVVILKTYEELTTYYSNNPYLLPEEFVNGFDERYFAHYGLVLLSARYRGGEMEIEAWSWDSGVLTVEVANSYSTSCGMTVGTTMVEGRLVYVQLDEMSIANLSPESIGISVKTYKTIEHELDTIYGDESGHWWGCYCGLEVEDVVSDHEFESGVCWFCGYENPTFEYTVNYHANKPERASNEVFDLPEQEIWSSDASYVLPSDPALKGWRFDGWVDINGNLIIDGYVMASEAIDVNLYATWVANTYTVVYNANKPANASNEIINVPTSEVWIYDTDTVMPLEPSLVGWIFEGWYDSNGEKIVEQNNLTVEQGDVVNLYAYWSPITYYIFTDIYDCNEMVELKYDESYTLSWNSTWKDSFDSSAIFDGWYYSGEGFDYMEDGIRGNKTTLLTTESDYTIKNWTTVDGACVCFYGEIHFDSTCFTGDTMVALENGSYVRLDSLEAGDVILSWNAFTGELETMPISLFWNHGENWYNVISLNFSNGKTVKVVTEHGFFDSTLNKYVYIDYENYSDYIGHEFACLSDYGMFENVLLLSATFSYEYTSCFSLRTACNDNAIVEGFLTLTHEDIPGFLTYFEFGEDYKYDEAKMEADIARYGLYTYDDWKEYVSYEEFLALNGQYLKIAVGKGFLTEEDIIQLIVGMR